MKINKAVKELHDYFKGTRIGDEKFPVIKESEWTGKHSIDSALLNRAYGRWIEKLSAAEKKRLIKKFCILIKMARYSP